MENQRPVTILFIIGGAAVGVFVRSALRAVMSGFGIEDPMLGGVAATSVLVGIISGFAGFLVLMRNERSSQFADSVVHELKSITWPSRDETVNNTGVVVGTAMFLAFLLAGYDLIWAKLAEIFIYSSG